MRIYLASGTSVVPGILEQYPQYTGLLGWLNTPRSAMSFDTLQKTRLPIGVDNSAFTFFDEKRYRALVSRINCEIDWITLPDVVSDAETTTKMFHEWREQVDQPLAYVGQDGCEDIEIPWSEFKCFFIGGSTEWKLSQTAASVVKHAQSIGKKVHMGRVNSQKRLRYAHQLGVDSIDGSGYSRFMDKYLVRDLEFLYNLGNKQYLF